MTSEITEVQNLHERTFERAVADGTPVLVAIHEEMSAGRDIPELNLDAIDRAIAELEKADTELDLAKHSHGILKGALISVVKKYGTVPPHAEQSKRLFGRRNVATITTGTVTTVNEAAVDDLNTYCDEQSILNVFYDLFATETKYKLIDGARNVLAAIQLPKRTHEKVLSLFGRCFDIKPKAPSLKVELIEPVKPAKKPRAGKAAA